MRRVFAALVIYALSATGLVVAWLRFSPPAEAAPTGRTAAIADTRVIAAEGVVEDLEGTRLRDLVVLIYDASQFGRAGCEPIADAPTDEVGRFRVYGSLRAATLVAAISDVWATTTTPEKFEAGKRDLRLVCRTVGGLGARLTLDGKPFGADDLARVGAGLFAVDASGARHAFAGRMDPAGGLRSAGLRRGRFSIELRNGDRRRLLLAGTDVVAGSDSFPPPLNPFELGSLADCRDLLMPQESRFTSSAYASSPGRPKEPEPPPTYVPCRVRWSEGTGVAEVPLDLRVVARLTFVRAGGSIAELLSTVDVGEDVEVVVPAPGRLCLRVWIEGVRDGVKRSLLTSVDDCWIGRSDAVERGAPTWTIAPPTKGEIDSALRGLDVPAR